MKKLKTTIATLTILLITTLTYGNTPTDSVHLIKETDAMNGKTYVYGSRAFVVAEDDNKKGFRVDTYIREDMSFGFIVVTLVGLGSCNENDELIILCDSGQKVTKKSWNKFNCKGDAYFNLTEAEIDILRKNPIDKIRVTNGRTYDSYTGQVKAKDKSYFMQLFYALDNKIIKKTK